MHLLINQIIQRLVLELVRRDIIKEIKIDYVSLAKHQTALFALLLQYVGLARQGFTKVDQLVSSLALKVNISLKIS